MFTIIKNPRPQLKLMFKSRLSNFWLRCFSFLMSKASQNFLSEYFFFGLSFSKYPPIQSVKFLGMSYSFFIILSMFYNQLEMLNILKRVGFICVCGLTRTFELIYQDRDAGLIDVYFPFLDNMVSILKDFIMICKFRF